MKDLTDEELLRLYVHPYMADPIRRQAFSLFMKGYDREDICLELNIPPSVCTRAISQVKSFLKTFDPNFEEMEPARKMRIFVDRHVYMSPSGKKFTFCVQGKTKVKCDSLSEALQIRDQWEAVNGVVQYTKDEPKHSSEDLREVERLYPNRMFGKLESNFWMTKSGFRVVTCQDGRTTQKYFQSFHEAKRYLEDWRVERARRKEEKFQERSRRWKEERGRIDAHKYLEYVAEKEKINESKRERRKRKKVRVEECIYILLQSTGDKYFVNVQRTPIRDGAQRTFDTIEEARAFRDGFRRPRKRSAERREHVERGIVKFERLTGEIEFHIKIRIDGHMVFRAFQTIEEARAFRELNVNPKMIRQSKRKMNRVADGVYQSSVSGKYFVFRNNHPNKSFDTMEEAVSYRSTFIRERDLPEGIYAQGSSFMVVVGRKYIGIFHTLEEAVEAKEAGIRVTKKRSRSNRYFGVSVYFRKGSVDLHYIAKVGNRYIGIRRTEEEAARLVDEELVRIGRPRKNFPDPVFSESI